MFNRNHSDTSKQKMSKAKKLKYRGKGNPMFGKSHSKETKQKIATSKKGKVWVYEPFTHLQRLVTVEELSGYQADGWVKGRPSLPNPQ